MPQATGDFRALMNKWFGDPISEQGPMQHLFSRGFTEANGLWYKPTPSYTPSVYDVACLLFLRDEWDFDWAEPLFDTVTSLLKEFN